MTKDDAKLLAALVFLALLLGGLSWWGVANWRECRRLHPWWYCVGDRR